MDYIYTRVSTDDQTTTPQLEALRLAYPRASEISEVMSSRRNRPQLQGLLSKLQTGDRLIVVALDRLGRRTTEVLGIIEQLDKKGVALISQREGVDYSTPMGRLVTQILASVAEMERSLISERTKAGLKAARGRGAKIGAPKGHRRNAGWRKEHSAALIADLRTYVGIGLSCRKIAEILSKTYGSISFKTIANLRHRYSI